MFFTTYEFFRYQNFMFSISASDLIWNRRDWTVRKGNGVWIWIQLPFNENCIKISNKNSAFDLPRNYLKLCEYQHSSFKKLKTSIQITNPLDSEFSLKHFLIKNRFIEETIYSGNLDDLSPTNVRNTSSHCRNFNWLFHIVFDISHKLVTPPLKLLLILCACKAFNVP